MSKVIFKTTLFVTIFVISFALAQNVSWAEEATPIEENTGEGDPVLEIEGLTPMEGLGNIPVVPSEDLVGASTEKTMWQKTYPILIDIAIGVGAALIFLAIWWLVKLKKKENRKSKVGAAPKPKKNKEI